LESNELELPHEMSVTQSRKESTEEMFYMLGDLALMPHFSSQRRIILEKQRAVAKVLTRRALRDMKPVGAAIWGWKWMAKAFSAHRYGRHEQRVKAGNHPAM
jgi:hypothetical protein